MDISENLEVARISAYLLKTYRYINANISPSPFFGRDHCLVFLLNFYDDVSV